MTSTAISESLSLVGEHLTATLSDARRALEGFAEGDSGAEDGLERCAELLHTARGALQITETYGASLLAEEMEATCRHIAAHQDRKAATAEGVEALSRAIVQLPAYVERILGGGRDIPLVLLPLLNDLRATRGCPLLSESTLLLLDIGAPEEQAERIKRPAPSGEDIDKLSRLMRPQFQIGLLGWIKGTGSQQDVHRMSNVADRLERAASVKEVHQLWWVVGGVLEALEKGGLSTSVALKRLIGQADREIKRLHELGESKYAQQPPVDLINNLLYYVARSSAGGERVAAIRSAFNLSSLGPGDEQVELLRESLAAPSPKLMKTVADAIREDLAKAKDVLDIYVRTGMSKVDELIPQVELLAKISDTLGVLGLGSLRESVHARSRELQAICDSGGGGDEADLVTLAAALLEVENRLDTELVALIVPAKSEDEPVAAPEADPEFADVVQAVMRECMVNLARVKEAITQVLDQADEGAEMDGLPAQLRGISAGLLMLEKDRAVEVVERIGEAISECVRQGYEPAQVNNLNRLADAMVSLEYYMETLQAARKEPLYMLDNAERCLQAIVAPVEPAAPADVATEASGFVETLQLPDVELPAVPPVHDVPADTGEISAATSEVPDEPLVRTVIEPDGPSGIYAAITPTEVLDEPAAGSPAVIRNDGAGIEPELLETFIEEARDEIASIGRHFPSWARDPDDAEALITLRRAFHTLKGSGRMVGADLIAEFSWKIENLLNRLISNTLDLQPQMLRFLEEVVAALPELLEQLEIGTPPATDIETLVSAADDFTEGRVPEGFDVEPLPVDEPEPEPEPEPVSVSPRADFAEPGMDPVLLEILSKEVATHLVTVRGYIADCRAGVPPWSVSADVRRACHTLHGSVTMADATSAIPLSTALDEFIDYGFSHPAELGEVELSFVEEAADTLEVLVQRLADGETVGEDTQLLESRLRDALQILQSVPVEEPASIEDVAEATEEVGEPEVPALDEATIAASQSDEPQPVFDAEIAAIFSEEASEILEAADLALDRLSAGEDADMTVLAELQRHLHTLKGGARMAGVQSIGDFSHELETLLIRLNEGQVRFSAAARDALQASIDELHRMREQVLAGTVAGPSADLVARLSRMLSGAPVPLEEVPERQEAPEERETVIEAETREAGPSEELPEADSGAEAAKIVVEEETAASEPAHGDTTPMVPEPAGLGALARELTSDEPTQRAVTIPDTAASDAAGTMPAEPAAPIRREMARVDSAMLEDLLNSAGEISIFHSRLNQQLSSIQFNLAELGQTVIRLREQLRKLEMETEAQILHRHQAEAGQDQEFDPLQLDRYSTIQQLSRALAETANDVSSLKDLLQSLAGEAETVLVQQARTTVELQDNLMRTRMVPFQQHVPRLSRLVRQAASEHGRQVDLNVEGTSGELDRQVLEKMLPPFEHMLRNAVIHGIESVEERESLGKPAQGQVIIRFRREGSEVVIEVVDDGRGLDIDSIRRKAEDRGIISAGQELSDDEAAQLILRSGFSTADRLTQAAGRGIGMDVVVSEIAKLGGTLGIETVPRKGCTFSIRLPYTLAITQAFIVRAGNETYALPLPTVEGVIRIPRDEFDRRMADERPTLEYGGQEYALRYLGQYLGLGPTRLAADDEQIPVILVRAGEHSTALITDEAVDSREIVVKPVGAQLAKIRGVSGATILGDGRIVVILDAPGLLKSARGSAVVDIARPARPEQVAPLALVVDDSITMRRVSQRLLERNGFRVTTAKDGIEALRTLRDELPGIILLDIEMPRMDGYEFAQQVRNDPETAGLPIIMVTSRVSEKHRARAIEIGVNDYLGKPYQEHELLDAIRNLLGEAFPAHA